MIYRKRSRFVSFFSGLLGLCVFQASPIHSQAVANEGLVTVGRGTSALLPQPTTVRRISIGDPAIADAMVVSPREVLVNGRALGSTTLFVWDVNDNRHIYNIEVTVDGAALQRQIRALFPREQISVTASGNMVILSGQTTTAAAAARALEIARGTGATVVDNLTVPAAQQVLLQVRFAEVTRTAATELGVDYRVGDTRTNLSGGLVAEPGERVVETLSDGLVRIFLFEKNFQFEAVVRALKSRGLFRSLAEPNLIALDGTEASFLAGGEFPYPVPQSGGQGANQTITVVFREYGVRLRFIPRVTAAGNIRLDVEPEVSSLDFSSGLRLSGFAIPSILSRRAKTQVELRSGQTFAIAGLLDNSFLSNMDRIPVLGDIPVLGSLFQSRNVRQRRSELLVLVTPRLVEPLNASPPVPTGEPESWPWDPSLQGRPPQVLPSRPAPAARPGTPPNGATRTSGEPGAVSVRGDASRTHVVVHGETLAKIAGRYRVSASSVRTANNLASNTIQVGQKLVIPELKSRRSGSPTPHGELTPAAVRGGAARTHIVAPGETVAGLAWHYGVSKQSLRTTNNLSGDTLRVGQKLLVPGS